MALLQAAMTSRVAADKLNETLAVHVAPTLKAATPDHDHQRIALTDAFVIGLAAIGLGYAVTRWAWPDPTLRLVRDLTLAEHLDEYEEVGSFEFLNQLAESHEFGGDTH